MSVEPKPEEILETLTKARQLLLDKEWTQGCFGREASGKACMTIDPKCSAYSMEGALRAATLVYPVRWACEDVLAECIPIKSSVHLYGWNDAEDRTKEQVIAVYDRAIAHMTAVVMKSQR